MAAEKADVGAVEPYPTGHLCFAEDHVAVDDQSVGEQRLFLVVAQGGLAEIEVTH